MGRRQEEEKAERRRRSRKRGGCRRNGTGSVGEEVLGAAALAVALTLKGGQHRRLLPHLHTPRLAVLKWRASYVRYALFCWSASQRALHASLSHR